MEGLESFLDTFISEISSLWDSHGAAHPYSQRALCVLGANKKQQKKNAKPEKNIQRSTDNPPAADRESRKKERSSLFRTRNTIQLFVVGEYYREMGENGYLKR